MKFQFNPEANVATYEIVVDSLAPVTVTPAQDGTYTYDMGPLNLAPGDHTFSAEACNASGCSAFISPPLTFIIPQPIPIPDVPSGSFVE